MLSILGYRLTGARRPHRGMTGMIPAPRTRASTAAQPPSALHTRAAHPLRGDAKRPRLTGAARVAQPHNRRPRCIRAPHSRRPAASLTASPSLRHFSSPAAARTRARKAAPGSEVPVRGGSPRRRCSMPRCTAARKARSALSRLASSASWPE